MSTDWDTFDKRVFDALGSAMAEIKALRIEVKNLTAMVVATLDDEPSDPATVGGTITNDTIIEAVASVFNVPAASLKQNLPTSRPRHLARAKFAVLGLVREHAPGITLGELGKIVGYHNHTTARYAVIRAAELEECNPEYVSMIARCRAALTATTFKEAA